METPPGFAQYPRPQMPILVSGIRPMPPGAHLEAISDAFKLVQKDMATWVATALLSAVIYLLFYVPTVVGSNMLEYGSIIPAPGQLPSIAGVGESILLSLITLAVQVTLLTRMYKMALKSMRGQAISVGDLFADLGDAPRCFITIFCSSLLTAVGFLGCIIPAFWLSGAFSLAPFLVIDQGQSPFTAIGESFKVAGNFSVGISMFGIQLVLGIVAVAGLIACGVGVLITAPIVVVSMAIHYYYFFPEAFSESVTYQ